MAETFLKTKLSLAEDWGSRRSTACPNGVDIPKNFRIYNLGRVYGLMDWAKQEYLEMDAGKRADSCIECGECEPQCPNTLPIMEQLAEVSRSLQ